MPKILITDDDPHVLIMLSEILMLRGFEVETASSGEDTLDLLIDDNVYDAIVLDYKMRKMDGVRTYYRIRSMGIQCPVILISGYDLSQYSNLVAQDPNFFTMQKPFSYFDLTDTLKNLLAVNE